MPDPEKETLQFDLKKFAIPFLICAIYLLAVYLLYPLGMALFIIGNTLLYTVAIIPKKVFILWVITVLIPLNYGPLITILSAILPVIIIDLSIVILLYYHFDFIKKVPFIGKIFDRWEKFIQKKLEKKSYIYDMGFLGLLFFHLIPVQGFGPIVTTILGRILGIDKFRVAVAVSLGTIIGAVILGIIFYYFVELLFELGVLTAIVVIIVIGLIFMVYHLRSFILKNN